MMLCKIVAVLVLLASAMADTLDREVYDDTPGEVELLYPEQNYVDTLSLTEMVAPRAGPRPTTPPRKLSENARRMLLYKMLTTLRNHDALPSFLSVPKWITMGTALVLPDTFNFSPLKGPMGNMFKRSGETINPIRPQQKWKIKKGKGGSYMICYFKLCGPPMPTAGRRIRP